MEDDELDQVVAPQVPFDPSLIFEGLDQAEQFTQQGIDYAENYFGQAAEFQQPFFNDTQGFNQFSGGILGGRFDPQNPANAFSSGPGDPEYEFRLQEGQRSINSQAGAQGLTNSGSRLRDLNAFAQGTSSQFSTEDLARRQAVAQQNAGNLQALSGFEQSAANNLSNINTGLGSLGSNAYIGLGGQALGAFGAAAGMQNSVALANAGFQSSADQFNINSDLKQQGIDAQNNANSTSGNALGTVASIAPYFFL